MNAHLTKALLLVLLLTNTPAAPTPAKLGTAPAPGQIVGPWRKPTENQLFGTPKAVKAQGRILPHKNQEELRQQILATFGGVMTNPAIVFLADSDYYLPTKDEVREVMAASAVSRMDYIDNRFDCDDFAFGVRGEFSLYAYEHDNLKRYAFCFGIIMGNFKWATGYHAACFFVADDGQVCLVEPRRAGQKMPAGEALSPRVIDPQDINLSDPKECFDCNFIFL